MSDVKFAEGLYFDRNDNAPDFVIGSIGIQRDKFISWLQEQSVSDRGYVNLDVKKSKNGKLYVALNDWKPQQQSRPKDEWQSNEPKPQGAENPDEWETPF